MTSLRNSEHLIFYALLLECLVMEYESHRNRSSIFHFEFYTIQFYLKKTAHLSKLWKYKFIISPFLELAIQCNYHKKIALNMQL